MATNPIRWDGITYPYAPPKELAIDPSLSLHCEADEAVDPVTHEVLRHALWNVNVEHGQSIIRTSGSPICAYGHDFNPAILDERGGFVYFGQYNLFLAVSSASVIKWTLEHRASDPGIHDGDVFLTNDPWIGAVHQPDVVIAAPVFVDDRLFCWVANSLHTWDLGGTAPGGFNPMADSVYSEAPCVPPMKIVERGRLRGDVAEMFVRNSRLPHLVSLDMRSQITGTNVAADRIKRLVGRYGASTVKATMRKIQDDSETAFGRRLATIPDGTWTEEGHLEVKLPGDRGLYLNRLTLTKRGDRLTFSNAGSSAQSGALNTTLGAWTGGILSMLATSMLFDQMLALEGALRHCVFEPEPGTITCALRPGAVSCGPPTALQHTTGLTGLVVSKMLATSSDSELRTEVASCMGVMAFPVNAISGIDQRGEPYASFLNDPVGAALPARSWTDGQDTGGFAWDLASTIPNVEDNELFHPVLYLWRRELPDSGGAGRFRGGNGCEAGVIAHKSERIDWVTVAAQCVVPGPGLFGGYPTSTNRFGVMKDANIGDQLRRTGRMPEDPGQLDGTLAPIGPKTSDTSTGADDLWIFAWSGAGGYGDPLDRDPQHVLDDVVNGRVSEAWAAEAYGVVLVSGAEPSVDAPATRVRRREIVEERLAEGRPWEGEVDGQTTETTPPDGRVNDDLAIVDGEYRFGGASLGPATRNYKLGTLVRDLPLRAASPQVVDSRIFVDHDVTFRQYIDPGTGRLLQTEVVVDGGPPQWDLRPGPAV